MITIKLADVLEKLNYEILYKSKKLNDINISSAELARPGLQMTGYFHKFNPDRIQIIGNAEWHYLNELSREQRYKALDEYLSYPTPVVILARALPAFPEMLTLCVKHDKTIATSPKPTSRVVSDLYDTITVMLAPAKRVHGVMLEVYGIGVLITGKSGVGKSETALDLVTKGCRLIADDAVDIQRIDDKLRATCPELLKYFLEVRGIGIVDVERLYGIGAVKEYEYLDLVVELENWIPEKNYDRIGLDEDTTQILGLNIPKVTIPVRPGRNIAMIVEVAAKNNRQKRLGYNAAEALDKRVRHEIKNQQDAKKLEE